MNPSNNRIEELSPPPGLSSTHNLFAIPAVGTRVASFAGYHWKIKSINPETQEIALEQDGLTSLARKMKDDGVPGRPADVF